MDEGATIHPNPEYENLCPPLSKMDFDELKESINESGIRTKIHVLRDGTILCGHNRFKIGKDLGIDIPYEVVDIPDENVRRIYVIEDNLKRRHLTTPWRIELVAVLEQFVRALARERHEETLITPEDMIDVDEHQEVRVNLPSPPRDTVDVGRVRDIMGAKAGVCGKTWENAQIVKRETPDVWVSECLSFDEKKNKEKRSIDSALLAIKKRWRDEERARRFSSSTSAKGIIKFGDAIQLLDSVETESMDELLTDPPYSSDIADFPTFLNSWLGKALSKVKTTGRVFIFSGPYPEEIKAYIDALNDFCGEDKKFRFGNILIWTYKNTLGPTPTYTFKQSWQAIFYIYGKDAEKLNPALINEAERQTPTTLDIFDVLNYNQVDGRIEERHHPWEKPERLIKHLLAISTREGDKILDIFAGSGTIGLVSAEFGRPSLSFEVDSDYYNICRERGLIDE